MTQDIVESFGQYFRLVAATTPELMEKVYRLRYQVFCLETGFEDPEWVPDGMERDEYDLRAGHYLIQHIKTGSHAATTRLILPDSNNPERPFPIEKYSRIERTDLLQSIPRRRLGEVSRFCVSKDFKRRHGEKGTIAGIPSDSYPHHVFGEAERRVFPYITLGLIASLIRMTLQHGITHWYAVMEKAFISYLKQLGINFTPIGPTTEYHGQRIPCIIAVQHLLNGVKEKNLQAWHLLNGYGRLSKN